MKHNVLLLGGNGDIGTSIKNKFETNGYEVNAPASALLNLENMSQIDSFMKKQNGFDVIIQCAGINNPLPIDQISEQELLKTFYINVFGFYKIIQLNIEHFKKIKNGWVLGISSIYGQVAREYRSPYVMSKHALNGLIKTISIELGVYNVKSNSLSPGFVNTKMTSKNNSPEKIKSFESKIPLGRLAKPEDIANTAFFLCSKENEYINGQNIVVDGGFLAGGFQK